MTPLLLGLLLCVGVAVAVIVAVALPHLRVGARVLTPEAERYAEEARRRAAGAAGATVSAVRERVAGQGSAEDAAAPAEASAVPPRQVASPAATPAPGTPLAVDPKTREQLDRLRETSGDRVEAGADQA